MTTVDVRHSPCLSGKQKMSPLASREVTQHVEKPSRETSGSPCLVRAVETHHIDSDIEEGM